MEISVPALLAGVLAGLITGILPGIHVNTIAALLLAGTAAGFASGLDFSALTTFICAMAIAHTFFDVIPGLFLGIPNDAAFALLPGHRLVGKGRGREAVRLSAAGSTIGLGMGLAAVYLLLQMSRGEDNLMVRLSIWITDWMFWILAVICLVLVFSEKNKLAALLSFLLSGLLGIVTFGTPLVPGGTSAAINILFPVLAGMFGLAGLFYAIHTHQTNSKPISFSHEKKIGWQTLAAPSINGGLAGGLVGLLPGLGSANAATLLLLLERFTGRGARSRDESDRRYLVTTSALNTSEAIFAIVALYLIGKSRSGASVALDQVLGQISIDDIGMIISVFLIAGCVTAVVLVLLAKPLATGISRLDARRLNTSVIVFIVLLTGLLMGSGGLLILAVATLVGLVPIFTGARRAQLMGFFLVPVMLFYSGHQAAIVSTLKLEQRLGASLSSPDLHLIAGALIFTLLVAFAVYLAGKLHPTLRLQGQLLWAVLAALFTLPLAWSLLKPVNQTAPLATASTPASWRPMQLLRVIDGDSIVVTANARRYRVRLARIDAPETAQPGGAAATRFATAFMQGQPLSWQVVGVDIYGRMLAEVKAGEQSLNEQLVQQGHAWVYPQFRSTEQQLMEFERQAKSRQLGLWKEASPLPPWQWRRLH